MNTFIKNCVFNFFILMLTISHYVFADTNTQIAKMNSTVVASCSVAGNGILGINFGTFDNLSSDTTVTKYTNNSFNVRCSKGMISQISIDKGEHSGQSSDTTRSMSDGEEGYLSYEIYTSATGSVLWGNGNTVPYKAISSSPYSVIVYVRIPPHQIIEAGTYTDTVTISIKFHPYSKGIHKFKAIITIVFLPDLIRFNIAQRSLD